MASRTSATKSGLRLFLVVVTALFTLMSVAYLENTSLSFWTPIREPQLLWLNTVFLIFSSITIHRAQKLAGEGMHIQARRWLIFSAVLAVAFLFGQMLAWIELFQNGYFASENPAYAFYYLMTAVHGLHIFGGVTVLSFALDKVYREDNLESINRTIRLCATYWHYLLLVWIILFAMMLMDNSRIIDQL
ncbi:MAG: cytochrome c oxidase subunit 3 [Rhodobacteraceae bacterium]|nr:cytochrome c oxidase subunit 3 [Paracoccaceae bacterium]